LHNKITRALHHPQKNMHRHEMQQTQLFIYFKNFVGFCFHVKIMVLQHLIGCHSIPLWSNRDHDLVALFGTLGFECGCLLFPADVELYDPSYSISHGSGDTQDGCLSSDTTHSWEAILEYHKVQRHERIPDSHRDIFHGSH
jgi:hypothetical protein